MVSRTYFLSEGIDALLDDSWNTDNKSVEHRAQHAFVTQHETVGTSTKQKSLPAIQKGLANP